MIGGNPYIIPNSGIRPTENHMYSASLTVLAWLRANEWLALWVEGLALLAIFIWDRKDHREDHDENIEQMKIMSRNAVAAETAANAAKKSAEVARDTLHLTQAADIHIKKIILKPKGPLSGDTAVYVVVKNHGHTRAEQFTEDLSMGIKERAAGISLPKRDIALVIGARHIFTIAFAQVGDAIIPEDLAMISGGKIPLKIWGALKYRDIFGKNYSIDCECTYSPTVETFLIDRYEHRYEEDAGKGVIESADGPVAQMDRASGS